jgi:hypothetical protein
LRILRSHPGPNCSRIRFRPGWADPPFGNVALTIPFR